MRIRSTPTGERSDGGCANGAEAYEPLELKLNRLGTFLEMRLLLLVHKDRRDKGKDVGLEDYPGREGGGWRNILFVLSDLNPPSSWTWTRTRTAKTRPKINGSGCVAGGDMLFIHVLFGSLESVNKSSY